MDLLDSNASALYSGLTISQMRDLILALGGPESAHGLPNKSREDLIKRLDASSDKSRLALLAHRIEVLAAYKHCIPVLLANAISAEQIQRKIQELFPRTIKGFVPLSSSETDLLPQCSIADPEGDRLLVKFVHLVEVWETEQISRRERVTRLVKRRHVVILTFRPSKRLVTVSFPGFTHGLIGDERKTYLDIALSVLNLVRTKFGYELESLKLKAAAETLLEDKSKDVIDLKRSALPLGGGKLTLDSQNSKLDAAVVLAESLRKEGGIDVTSAQVRTAFRSMEAGDLALLWQKIGVITRISFHGTEPEILFVWSASEPAISIVEQILSDFLVASENAPQSGVSHAREFLRAAVPGTIIRPSYLAQHFSLSGDAALGLMFAEAEHKSLAVRFRIKSSEQLVGFHNDWVRSVPEIPRELVNNRGEKIQGHDPSNIEIAFERVAG